jgi:hypothetical protein
MIGWGGPAGAGKVNGNRQGTVARLSTLFYVSWKVGARCRTPELPKESSCRTADALIVTVLCARAGNQ